MVAYMDKIIGKIVNKNAIKHCDIAIVIWKIKKFNCFTNVYYVYSPTKST